MRPLQIQTSKNGKLRIILLGNLGGSVEVLRMPQ
jgi:hypothetical protein